MAQDTFWTGSSLDFVSGQLWVQVNTGSSLSSIRPNMHLKAGNYSEPVEVDYVDAANNKIYLVRAWPGPTGTASATITPGFSEIVALRDSVESLITPAAVIINNAKNTAVADSIGVRTSTGAFKVADADADDEAIAKGQLGAAAYLESYKDYGIQKNVVLPAEYDLDNIDNTCFKTGYGGLHVNASISTGSGNPFPNFNGAVTILTQKAITAAAGTYLTQIAISSDGATANAGIKYRSCAGGAWTPWRELYHSSMTAAQTITDWDADLKGLMFVYAPNGTVNPPLAGSINFGGIRVNSANDNNGWEFAIGKSTSGTEFLARVESAGVYDGWVEIFHSENTNFTQFGDGGNDIQRIGFGVNTTTISCYVDTNRFAKPNGINVTTPFTIQTLDGTTVATGITPTLTAKSVGIGIVTFSGLTGISVDKPYRLISGQFEFTYA